MILLDLTKATPKRLYLAPIKKKFLIAKLLDNSLSVGLIVPFLMLTLVMFVGIMWFRTSEVIFITFVIFNLFKNHNISLVTYTFLFNFLHSTINSF